MNHIKQSGWNEKACYGGQESDGTGKHSLDHHGWRIISVCSYCKIAYKEVKDDTYGKDMITHGLCPVCEKIENEKLDESLKQANDISKRIK